MFDYHHSCVSVGMTYAGQMVARYELYHAVRGTGAWLNDCKLVIADCPIREGIVAYGCARYNDSDTALLFDAGGYINRVDGGSITLDKPCSIVVGTETAWREVRAMIAKAGFVEQG